MRPGVCIGCVVASVSTGACVELPAIGGATNCTFIHHVHFATSVLLSRDDKHLALTDSAGFLADLAQAGFPTNRLVADNKP